MQFSKNDNDNDEHPNLSCAEKYRAAWWYKGCHWSSLNGLYLDRPHSSQADGLNWRMFGDLVSSLKRSEMKVKRNPKSLN